MILSSSYGKYFHITISGGSHEDELKLVVSGLPADFKWSLDDLLPYLQRRMPGISPLTTSRKEEDAPVITNTNPLTIVVRNKDYNSKDYNLDVPRPSHCDYTAYAKYGNSVNLNGGGPFSGRMTVMMVIAGSIARKYLENYGISIHSHILQLGDIKEDSYLINIPTLEEQASSDSSDVHMLYADSEAKARTLLSATKANGDSIGAVVEYIVDDLPLGLGGPMFDGLEGLISKGLFAIPGVKGVDFGSGFSGSSTLGSQNNDPFIIEGKNIRTLTNNHGGILGGISSGMPLIGKVAFKPTPSISIEQSSINIKTLKPEAISTKGRHDPCIALRGAVVVESMVAISLADVLLSQSDSLFNLRGNIDGIDSSMIALLLDRINTCAKVGAIKKTTKNSVLDVQRENNIVDRLALEFPDLSKELIASIYEEIFTYSKSIQEKIVED